MYSKSGINGFSLPLAAFGKLDPAEVQKIKNFPILKRSSLPWTFGVKSKSRHIGRGKKLVSGVWMVIVDLRSTG